MNTIDLLRAGGVAPVLAERWADPLDIASERFEINTFARIVHWLATLIHESARFTRLEENLHYSAKRLLELWPLTPRRPWGFTEQEAADYAMDPERIADRVYGGRMGNGPEGCGDGWDYRGRGPIQLTGRENYTNAGNVVGVDLVAHPDLLLLPSTGAMVAGWFWMAHGCNPLADVGDTDAIRRLINGGHIGADEVLALVTALEATA